MLRLEPVCQNCVLGRCVCIVFLCTATSPFFILLEVILKRNILDIRITKLRKLEGCLLHGYDLSEKKTLFTITINSTSQL